MSAAATASKTKLKQAEAALRRARAAVARLRRAQAPEPVEEWTFRDAAGRPVPLRGLFGGKSELVLVHNMGAHCRYCTLWADGFKGLTPHLEDRAAFAVESADLPAAMGRFHRSRGWTFTMVSSAGTGFKHAMGFADRDGSPQPGVSVFRLRAGKVVRTARDTFGPGDDYCAAWHFFDLLPGGSKGWSPQYRY